MQVISRGKFSCWSVGKGAWLKMSLREWWEQLPPGSSVGTTLRAQREEEHRVTFSRAQHRQAQPRIQTQLLHFGALLAVFFYPLWKTPLTACFLQDCTYCLVLNSKREVIILPSCGAGAPCIHHPATRSEFLQQGGEQAVTGTCGDLSETTARHCGHLGWASASHLPHSHRASSRSQGSTPEAGGCRLFPPASSLSPLLSME